MEELGNTPKKESPIDIALNRLKSNISKVKELLPEFESILASVLTQPEKTTGCSEGTSKAAGGQTHLQSELILMSDAVVEIKEYLSSLKNRIQL